MVLEVPRPSSPSPAPSRLRGWLAHVVLTSMRRSNPESMENTPTNIPAGESVSKFGGGNAGNGIPEEALRYGYIVEEDEGLCGAYNEGAEQYALHGKGSLSGFNI